MVTDRHGRGRRKLEPSGYEVHEVVCVAGVMDRNYLALEPAADLAATLPLMARGRCALVQDGSRLVGLLTTDNLSEFLLLRRFGMEPVV